ncbi:MAG: NAD(P)H-dependent oxidoreductase [Hyphomicrobiales bacterium]
MTNTILKINASARHGGSSSRILVDELSSRLQYANASNMIERDISIGIPIIDEAWIAASQTSKENRTSLHRTALSSSDILISELKLADTLVIGVPIYNFGIPASLKAWIDQVCRAGETFSYTDNGPIGLLEGKTAYVIITSGGVKSGSEIDFATNYMKHVLGFIGISDVSLIKADQLLTAGSNKMLEAKEQIKDLTAA